MKNIQTIIHIERTSHDMLPEIAQHNEERQKNKEFMRFLKETPQTKNQNLPHLQKLINKQKGAIFAVLNEDGNIIGSIMINWFNPKNGEAEIWFRVDPNQQLHGVCSQAVALSLEELFLDEEIKSVTGRHSCLNKWSFHVFRKNEFIIEKYVPEQTFLPNIKTLTDDFKRIKANTHSDIIIPKNTLIKQWKTIHIAKNQEENIKDWLIKHNIITL